MVVQDDKGGMKARTHEEKQEKIMTRQARIKKGRIQSLIHEEIQCETYFMIPDAEFGIITCSTMPITLYNKQYMLRQM